MIDLSPLELNSLGLIAYIREHFTVRHKTTVNEIKIGLCKFETSCCCNRQQTATTFVLCHTSLRRTIPIILLKHEYFSEPLIVVGGFCLSHPHMSSPKAKGNPRDKVIFVCERSTLSWQVLSAACEWWLNKFLVCQDEQNREYFDINTESRYWWRAAVNPFDLQSSEVAPERYFAGQILSWAHCVIGCGRGFGKLIFKVSYPGSFQDLLASNPTVIKDMLLHLSDTEALRDAACKPLHVNLI